MGSKLNIIALYAATSFERLSRVNSHCPTNSAGNDGGQAPDKLAAMLNCSAMATGLSNANRRHGYYHKNRTKKSCSEFRRF